MAEMFADSFYKVERILYLDRNTDRVCTNTIHQLDQFFSKIDDKIRVNLNDYIYWRLAYNRLAWKMANGKQSYPYGDLVEKFCFYKNLKLAKI